MTEIISYSQWNQDIYMYQFFFQNQTTGFYIDVGANNGTDLSNSLLYEKLGWKGLLFEPIKSVFDVLVSCRKGICINKCAYSSVTTIDFQENTGYTSMLSGIVDDYDDRHKLRINDERQYFGGETKITKMETTTIQDELDKLNISIVDFISIDTEGSELAVLQGIDFKKTKVKVILLENNYKLDIIYEFLKPYNYIHDYTLGGDELFYNPELITKL